MSEQGMRSKVVKLLEPWNAISVENPALPGTPDVNYIEGWVELKWLRDWPKGEDTPVRVDHWTAQQRVWHLKRRLKQGCSWVLLQCKREWILLDGVDAILWLDLCDKAQLINVAAHYTNKGMNQKELMRWLSTDQRRFTLTGEDGEKLKRMLLTGTGSVSTDTWDGSED